jgi:hypothetical protein
MAVGNDSEHHEHTLFSVSVVLALLCVTGNTLFYYVQLNLGQQFHVLTHHGEVHGVTNRWRGAHLALIEARVPPLRVTDLQHPVFCLRRVDGLESLVASVGVTPDG